MKTAYNNSDIKGQVCPCCDRFIGPVDICPFCLTESARRPAFRYLRSAALLIGTIGLLILYLSGIGSKRPLIEIDKITPMMNFARVRVCGRIERKPYISKHNNHTSYLSFYISDGSNSLCVCAYSKVAEQIETMSLDLSKGRKVTVTGVLNASANGKTKINIQAPKDILPES